MKRATRLITGASYWLESTPADSTRVRAILAQPGAQTITCIISDSNNGWEYDGLTHFITGLQTLFDTGSGPDLFILDAHSDPEQLAGHIEFAQIHSTVCVITFGWWTTELFHRATANKMLLGSVPPHVYACTASSNVCDQAWGSRNIRGVRGRRQPVETLAHILRTLRPDATRVLLPFNRTLAASMPYKLPHDMCDGFEDACRALSLEPVHIGFDATDEVVAVLMQRAHMGDIIFSRPESGLQPWMYDVADACTKQGVTLFGSDHTSVRQGAAVGAGTSGSSYAAHVLRIVYYLLQELPVHQIPHYTVGEPFLLRYNPATLALQGIVLTEREQVMLGACNAELELIDAAEEHVPPDPQLRS